LNNLVLYIIFTFCHILCGYTQNLVPNHSFEEYSDCPWNENQVHFAEPWTNPGGASPDFFHECSNDFTSSIVGVPQNWQGYQQAKTGLGYTGIFTYDQSWEGKEYIHVELLDTLEKDQLYEVKFYAVLSKGSGYAINSLGLYFSDEEINSFDISFPNFTPQVISNEFITDKEEWVEVIQCYRASGTEKFLTIGNFQTNGETELEEVFDSQSSFSTHSYYYIDDISVIAIEDSSSCIKPVEVIIPNVFTPNGDGINDSFFVKTKNLEHLEFVILNRWGNLVFQGKDNESWDGQNRSGKELSEGVYFVKVNYIDPKDQKTKVKTGYVHLIR
jgi:gliding motility-associated-like protein